MRLKLITAAAAIAAATSAQAGDLAAPAPAVDYVKVCDAYGTGFWYIPGTETCLKIGGYVFGEWWVGDSDRVGFRSNGKQSGDLIGLFSWQRRADTGTWSRVRGSITVDARTNTEYGLLRSFIEVWNEVNTNLGSPGSSGGASTNVRLWQGFIQFGGLVVGRTESFFSFWTGYGLTAPYTMAYSFNHVNLLAYQFAFGNGVTATVSIEDPTTANPWGRRRNGAFIDSFAGSEFMGPTNAYGGQRLPDLVGNIRVDQAWGAAQVMGAVRQVNPVFGEKDVGFAIAAGIEINLPMIAAGDKFVVQGGYSQGAVNYIHSTLGSSAGGGLFANGALGGDYVTSARIGFDGDGNFFRRAGDLHLTSVWAIAAGFRHMFNPRWQFNIQGSYTDVDGFSDLDFKQWDAEVAIVHTIVPGFTVSAGVEYRSIDFNTNDNNRNHFDNNRIIPRGFQGGDDIVGAIRFLRVF